MPNNSIYQKCLKDGIKTLIEIPEEYKIWSAIHFIDGYEIYVNFLMLANNFLLGVDEDKGRLYAGKIGEREKNNCELSLYYMDVFPLNENKGNTDLIEFFYPTLYQEKIFFHEGMMPIFFSAWGKESSKGLVLPSSNGTLYQSIETTNIVHLRRSLLRYIYGVLEKSIKRNPQMFLIIKTILECCEASGCAYTKEDVLIIYEKYRIHYNQKSVSRLLHLKD